MAKPKQPDLTSHIKTAFEGATWEGLRPIIEKMVQLSTSDIEVKPGQKIESGMMFRKNGGIIVYFNDASEHPDQESAALVQTFRDRAIHLLKSLDIKEFAKGEDAAPKMLGGVVPEDILQVTKPENLVGFDGFMLAVGLGVAINEHREAEIKAGRALRDETPVVGKHTAAQKHQGKGAGRQKD